jgi:hypothetical protein
LHFRTDKERLLEAPPENDTGEHVAVCSGQVVEGGHRLGFPEGRTMADAAERNCWRGGGRVVREEPNDPWGGGRPWIAIKGKRVRASSADLEEILDWLARERVVDALVVQVPSDVTQDQYIIA